MVSSDDSELWHVAFSTEDVRVWSLDQLNDAFRFDVVSAGTLVQKHGTRGWQRLGVMAGIEPEGTPAGSPTPSDQAVQRALRDAGLLAQPSLPPPPASYAPAPFAPSPLAATSFAAASSSVSRRRQSSGAGWLFAAALLAAIPVLYRNDLLLGAAQRAGREAQYLSLEKAYLGGPAYGTPRQLAAQFPAAASAPSAALPADTLSAPPAAAAPATAVATAAVAARPSPSSAAASPGAISLDALPVEPANAQPAGARSAPASAARVAAQPAKAAAPVQLDEKPAKRAAAKPEEPVPSDPLKAAIFTAVKNDAKKK